MVSTKLPSRLRTLMCRILQRHAAQNKSKPVSQNNSFRTAAFTRGESRWFATQTSELWAVAESAKTTQMLHQAAISENKTNVANVANVANVLSRSSNCASNNGPMEDSIDEVTPWSCSGIDSNSSSMGDNSASGVTTKNSRSCSTTLTSSSKKKQLQSDSLNSRPSYAIGMSDDICGPRIETVTLQSQVTAIETIQTAESEKSTISMTPLEAIDIALGNIPKPKQETGSGFLVKAGEMESLVVDELTSKNDAESASFVTQITDQREPIQKNLSYFEWFALIRDLRMKHSGSDHFEVVVKDGGSYRALMNALKSVSKPGQTTVTDAWTHTTFGLRQLPPLV